MADMPSKIYISFETNEGYEIRKRDDDLIEELINEWNKLVDYLGEQQDV